MNKKKSKCETPSKSLIKRIQQSEWPKVICKRLDARAYIRCKTCTVQLERISYEKLLSIANNPELLRKYIWEQEEKNINRSNQRTKLRAYSLSSSGYGSLPSTPTIFSFLTPSVSELLKTSQLNSSINNKRKFERDESTYRHEFTVEKVLSIEAVQSQALFFVKWKNYPSSQNTWEPLANLIDCDPLKEFLEAKYKQYEKVVIRMKESIQEEIKENSLELNEKDQSKIIAQVDSHNDLEELTDLILLAQLWLASSQSVYYRVRIKNRVINSFLLRPYIDMRKRQLLELSKWKTKVNAIETMANIDIENIVDFDVPDPFFVYIKDSFTGAGVPIETSTETNNLPIGCKCTENDDDGCNWRSKCCSKLNDENFAYDKNGRLRIRTGRGIYECNNQCSCSPNCLNRVIQRGRYNDLCLFKTTNGCGWGVRTNKVIRKGEYVCTYVGEIILAEEADERGKKYDAIGRTYLFDLDYNSATSEVLYTIDAANYGNISHFLNHSCEPNLGVFPFWINSSDVNMPGLAFFSLRLIKPGEELTFDYTQQNQESTPTYTNLSSAEKVRCRCGAAKCRKVLF